MFSLPWYVWMSGFLVAVALGTVIVWLRQGWVRALAEAEVSRRDLADQEKRVVEQAERLETVLQLNRELAEAHDEEALVRASLSAVNRLVGGLGSTYVPFDAWGQPLPAFTFSELPEPVMKGWAEHLVSDQVRRRCSSCQVLHAAPEHACPLQFGPLGGAMNIYCLPLALGEKRLGMVNIYLPAGRELSPDLRRFLGGLLDEMAIAVEVQRLHDQEVVALRQLHHLRSPRAGLTNALQSFFDSLISPLGLDAVALRLRPVSDQRLADLEINIGETKEPFFSQLLIHWSELLEGEESCPDCYQKGWTWLVLPLGLPEGQVLGALIVARCSNDQFSTSQKGILETAAAQAALMIENERLNLSLEYNLVIQERTRLAREIHDGLAQMLAYLKMQAIQMQSALAQGDQARLARLLAESRQAIADAYTETRQAIDHLREGGEESLLEWLEQSAEKFGRITGMRVQLDLPEEQPGFPPEIQAQLIRIVQEAFNNIRKHSQAGEIQVHLRRLESAAPRLKSADWILEVRDDGRGFDPEDVPAAARYGLRGMRERADLIGAEFQIMSQLERGTVVRLFLPAQLEEMGE
jgi:two-component system nitrate/nitrite sensor histidine kinase NarX